MLETAMRLAVAAAVAIAVGLGVRALLLQLLPGAYLAVILMRATALCVVGLGTYVTLARVLGVLVGLAAAAASLVRLPTFAQESTAAKPTSEGSDKPNEQAPDNRAVRP
jgi:hypothetical protein